MAVGLPQSPYKRRLQTAGRCCFSNKTVLNSNRKRFRFKRDQVGIRKLNENEPVMKLRDIVHVV